MSSEKQYLTEIQKDLISASSGEGQDRSEQLHITTKGKSGKLLRKKLAIALGVRTNSSASTTSQSEGEDAQNVEVSKKQVRKTVDFRTSKNSPKIIREKEEDNSDKGSIIIRKTTRKTTDVKSEFGEILEENQHDDFADIEEKETFAQIGSKGHQPVTAKEFETFNRERSHDSSSARRTVTKRTKDADNVNEFLNYVNTDETERKTGINDVQDNNKSTRKKQIVEKEGNISKTESRAVKTNHENQNGSFKTSTSGKAGGYGSNSFEENLVQSEEVFSSYGEQPEGVPNDRQFGEVSEPQSSAKESVKLLREKIRKNARARQVSKSLHVQSEKTEEKKRKENIGKIQTESGKEGHGVSVVASDKKTHDLRLSNIPISVTKRNLSDTQARLVGDSYNNSKVLINESFSDSKKPVQVSKIPRRKSQNAKDEMGTGVVRLKINEIERQSNSAQTFSTNQPKDNEKMLSDHVFKQKGETERPEIALQQKSLHKMNSNLEKFLRKASKTSKESLIPTAISKQKNSLNTTTTKNENSKSLTNIPERQYSTISTSKINTRNVNQFDFDSIEAELHKLKATVFKTCEEFKHIRGLTVSVRDDLNELRNVYGSFV